jgi:hypothetical protein
MIVIGILLVGWAVGQVGELIADIDKFNADFSREMLDTAAFMGIKHIKKDVQKRVRSYRLHVWSTRSGVDPHAAMQDLPAGLRIDMMLHLCEPVLRRVPLFARLLDSEPSFARHFVERLRFDSYPEGEFIFHAGEIGECLYIIEEYVPKRINNCN